MRFTYDPETDILMIHLVDGQVARERYDRSERAGDGGPMVDVAEDGTPLAIEVMGASKRYGEAALASVPVEGSEPISLAEAAQRGGVSIDALKFAAQKGRLGARKIGRNWTTTPRELHAYLESRLHAGPGSATAKA